MHLPSGLKVTAQNARSRSANFRDAFQRLGRQIDGWIRAEINRQAPQRQIVKETIRTYHFADNRVLDHASRMQIAAQELDKRFGELIAARQLSIYQKQIEE